MEEKLIEELLFLKQDILNGFTQEKTKSVCKNIELLKGTVEVLEILIKKKEK